MRACLILPLLLCQSSFVSAEDLKNWFDDPFFQTRQGVPTCPAPLGPMLPQSKRNDEAHYRVERGASCWLAGKCTQPNAYWYDASIAKAVAKAFADSPDFADTSLWVTVQRRFVTVEGCISRPDDEHRIAALIEPLPDVERVIVQVAKPDDGKPPYALAPSGAK